MQASIELSCYPLRENFLEPIQQFIDELNKYPEIKIITNGMSTQLFGEFQDIMRILSIEMEKTMQNPHTLFVMKVANAVLDQYTPPCQ